MVIDPAGATPSGPSTPLLETIRISNRGSGSKWKDLLLLDVKEAKLQILLSLPLIITNVCYYSIALISVMFAGHLGDLPLAGATLANSWATVSGFAFMIGLSGALETLCGQGYGARLYGLMGIYLQACCIISFFFSLIVSVLWFYTEPVLILLHQQPDIAKTASLYIKYLIPGLFAFGFLNNILRFLQTQSIVLPLVVCSVLPILLHLGIVYALVYWVDLGFTGAPLGASISMWISFVMLASYVIIAKKIENTWKGFSLESFCFIVTTLKLALPSAAMVCLEYWAFEILVLIAGLLPNSENTTSLIAICVNTEAAAYMISYGLSAAASTRVSNELGAGCPECAKNAMAVTLKLSFLFTLVFVLALTFSRNTWAGFFSGSHSIIKSFASMIPLLGISIIMDSVQGVLSGVVRACGWQHLAMFVNLSTFYFIGLPISCILSFKFKFNAKGLWIGLICGLFCQAGSLLLMLIVRRDWRKLQFPPTN